MANEIGLSLKQKMERVRFAPSPTGPLHIGGVRTALFNYLYAKKEQGVFVVRIEDTDRARYVKGAEEYIFDALKWLSIPVDESPVHGGMFGPYRQSERKEIYKKYVQILINKGYAYYAFDTTETLQKMRDEAEAKGETFKYGKHNRDNLDNSLSLDEEDIKKKVLSESYVVRLKNVESEYIVARDLLRGKVSVKADEIDDKIIMKADGMPTYHFANVVDDHLMKITTVIRGEEWLPSLALHTLIYKYFDWEKPNFIHLPLILKTQGKGKLSKRDGDKGGFPVFPLTWENSEGFKEKGYLSEGVVNYISLLGWNSGDEQEIFVLEELKNRFGIGGLQKGGARFDIKKAEWINSQHLQQLDAREIIRRMGLETNENLELRVNLIRERANTMIDIEKMLKWFDETPATYDNKVIQKFDTLSCRNLLSRVREHYIKTSRLTKQDYVEILNELEIKIGEGMQCLRLCLFGELIGPDLFEFMVLLGKDVVLERINRLENNLI